jgi:hypothetical protein
VLLIIVGLLLILSVLILNVRFRGRYQRSLPASATVAGGEQSNDKTP